MGPKEPATTKEQVAKMLAEAAENERLRVLLENAFARDALQQDEQDGKDKTCGNCVVLEQRLAKSTEDLVQMKDTYAGREKALEQHCQGLKERLASSTKDLLQMKDMYEQQHQEMEERLTKSTKDLLQLKDVYAKRENTGECVQAKNDTLPAHGRVKARAKQSVMLMIHKWELGEAEGLRNSMFGAWHK